VEILGNHKPAGALRGGKYSLYDAGTRVPFFVCWKSQIKPMVSNALVCQMDLLASIAGLVKQPLNGTFDSQNILPALMGKSKNGRKDLVIEANSKMAYRATDWAFIPAYEGPKTNQTGNETGNSASDMLYNLKNDPGQKSDVSQQEKKRLKNMKSRFLELTNGFYKANVEEVELK
jgi:arylsulfatase A-like enzyme